MRVAIPLGNEVDPRLVLAVIALTHPARQAQWPEGSRVVVACECTVPLVKNHEAIGIVLVLLAAFGVKVLQ